MLSAKQNGFMKGRTCSSERFCVDLERIITKRVGVSDITALMVVYHCC